MALSARLHLGLSLRTVHHRIGRADEETTTPEFNSGWSYEKDAYHCSDGTLWVEYSDLPPTHGASDGRVTCIGGPSFTVGAYRG